MPWVIIICTVTNVLLKLEANTRLVLFSFRQLNPFFVVSFISTCSCVPKYIQIKNVLLINKNKFCCLKVCNIIIPSQMIFALFLYLFGGGFSFLFFRGGGGGVLFYCFCYYYLQNLLVISVISVILELLDVNILCMNHLVTQNCIF